MPESKLEGDAETFLQDFSSDEVFKDDDDNDAQLAQDTIDLETSLKDAEASPVVTLVDRILLQAISVGASDIHVEPQQKGCGCGSVRTVPSTSSHSPAADSSGDITLQNLGGSTSPNGVRPRTAAFAAGTATR